MKQKNETKIKENKSENKIKKENKQYKNTSIANHKYLQYTNLLLIISIFYFLYTKPTLKEKHMIEYLLATFLIVTIAFSQLFWNNPIKHSKIHKIDAIIAKIVISSFILYTIIYKFKSSYLFILLLIGISFYFSNYYSNQEWCSSQHLFCHGCLHIFCFIATFYEFAPILL
jgi:hypothetical protein